VCLDRALGDFEFLRDFVVVAALQEQLHNLLLTRA